VKKIAPAIVAVAIAVLVLLPASAQACSVQEGYHCYSIAVWSMQGSEQVRGAYSEIETYYAIVPNWCCEFIDDELWVVFPSLSESWVEGA
jgi:hypothetical protein